MEIWLCVVSYQGIGKCTIPVARYASSGTILWNYVRVSFRNFEGRIHPLTRANYLASPLLVIAYALAGTVCIDFEKDPIGTDPTGQPVFLNEIWPSREEIQAAEKKFVLPAMFREVYAKISEGNPKWNSLGVCSYNSKYTRIIKSIVDS